ncbi:acetyltransferase [Colwellia sp. Bg11-12]|uniref:acetyltransferase n=1 Tax=Colwellia sp. Bg11-12 TaxID=2759817 RepID=UPI0015F49ACB|nr:acetyltransferase [Colwellia sp. Bg11-12]MBA6263212.1 acetyltransferase [Colwellia sp. Bg11-12]
MKKLIIIGAGGHGRVVADCAQQLGKYSKIFFLDDCFNEKKENSEWTVIGLVKDFPQYIDEADFVVAFGNNRLRKDILMQLKKEKASIVSLIHPSAVVSPHTFIGKGVVVFANAVINIGATIADGCIINTAATVDHDCELHQCVHVSPGVNIAGGVHIAQLSWIGIGSTIVEYITLADNTQVGAGAVVTQSTQANSLYLGIPAKRVRSLTKI